MRPLSALAALLLSACTAGGPEVEAGDARLQRSGARLLFSGQPFSGALVQRDASAAPLAYRPYRDGLLQGSEREWYANGQLRSERHYAQGRKVGRHRGWWADGRPRFDYEFADGEFHGQVLSWFENGQLAEQRRYAHGHEAGAQKTWFADGRQRANYVYSEGRRYGTIGVKLCITDENRHAALRAAGT